MYLWQGGRRDPREEKPYSDMPAGFLEEERHWAEDQRRGLQQAGRGKGRLLCFLVGIWASAAYPGWW